MEMTVTSPFASARYELEGEHLFYLPEDLKRQLTKPVPMYLIGSRGTGKTTLLRYLDWKERLQNEGLKKQLDGNAFESGIIGTYLRLPLIQLSLLDRWLSGTEKEDYGAVFSTYLELNCLELMIEAVLGLWHQGLIEPTLDAEAKISARLIELADPEVNTVTLVQCMNNVRTVRRRFDRMARDRLPAAEAQNTGVEIEGIGSIIRRAAPLLAELCRASSKVGPEIEWTFRLCLDEAEVLSATNPTLQLALNTLVRLSERPAFPVVAYVTRPVNDRNTLVKGLALQRADLDTVVLDKVSDDEFETIANGISRLRLSRSLSDGKFESAIADYNIRKQLGALNLNRLLDQLLRRSESEFAAKLLEDARIRQSTSRYVNKNNELPIYETYLLQRLTLTEPSLSAGQRRFSSESLRKKMVAAYLSICNELKTRPDYAYADMMLQTCDKCIRDFIWQMDSVFEQAALPVEEFVMGNEIDVKTQITAFRSASEKKLARLPRIIEAAPSLAQSLVENLGELTAVIQRSDPSDRHLASTERGLFSVVLNTDDKIGRSLAGIIADAAEWGFLRLEERQPPRWKFRVHTSLAPHFGFSYRGAYYEYVLLQEELESLARAQDVTSRREVIHKIVERVDGKTGRKAKSPRQVTLYE